MQYFSYLIHLAILVSLVASARNPRRFFYIAGFVIPLESLNIFYQVSLSWSKMLFPLAMVVLAAGRPRGLVRSRERRLMPLIALYGLALTTIMYLKLQLTDAASEAVALGWGEAQTTYRYPVQLLSYMFAFGMILLGARFVRDAATAAAAVKGYLHGALLNVAVGMYQLWAFYTGLPWLPGWFLSQELGSGYGELRNLPGIAVQLCRLSGFGGEPKHAAGNFVIAIALVVSLGLNGDRILQARWWRLPVLLLGIALTLSTSAWIGLLAVVLYLMFATAALTKGRLFKPLLVVAAFIVMLTIVGGGTLGSAIIHVRIVDPFADKQSLEFYDPKNMALLKYASANPWQLILGSGAGGVDFELLKYSAIWVQTADADAVGGTLTPSLTLPRLLGDFGIVGCVLLIAQWWKLVAAAGKYNVPGVRQFFIAGGIALLFVTQISLPGYLFLCGMLLEYARLVHRESISVAKPRDGLGLTDPVSRYSIHA